MLLALPPVSTGTAWEALPAGTILLEDSIVGTIDEGRKVLETLKVQEATIEVQGEVIEGLRGDIKALSGDMSAIAENNREMSIQIKALNDEFKSLKKQGRIEGGVMGAVIVTIIGIIAR